MAIMTYDQFVARQKARQQAGKPFGHFRQLTGKPFVTRAYVGSDDGLRWCGHNHRSSQTAMRCADKLAHREGL